MHSRISNKRREENSCVARAIVVLRLGKCQRKEDKSKYSNSRDMSLLSTVGKLYGRVLTSRIRSRTDGVLGEEQCGFLEWERMCRSAF